MFSFNCIDCGVLHEVKSVQMMDYLYDFNELTLSCKNSFNQFSRSKGSFKKFCCKTNYIFFINFNMPTWLSVYWDMPNEINVNYNVYDFYINSKKN